MAPFDRGTKRTCPHCGAKYYDLGKSPVLCPKCGKEFVLVQPKAPRATEAKKAPVEPEEAVRDPAAVEAGAEVISLDEVEEESDDTGEDIPDVEDVEVDDDLTDGDDDAFLETDEDDDKIEFNVPDDDKDDT